MLWHWLLTARRSLLASPLFSLITIASLSIGCCGALLAGSVLKQHLSFDRWVPHADRIAQVIYTENGESGYFLIPGVKPALDGKVSGVKAITRIVPSYGYFNDSGFGAGPATLEVDPDYFEIFELRFLEGSAETALGAPDSIVVTRGLADDLVGPGPALGKTVERRDTGRGARTYRISGVIENIPPATHQRFDSLVSLEGVLSPQDLSSVNREIRPGGLFVRLEDDVDVRQTLARAGHQIGETMTHTINTGRGVPAGKAAFSYDVTLLPLTKIHLSDAATPFALTSEESRALLILGIAATALLAVSAFNYTTLSLARSLSRRREVAIRKVLGASDGALAVHYLAESALVTAISLAIGFALAEILRPWFARTIGQPEILFQLRDPLFLGLSLLVFSLLAVAIGAYPSFHLARIRPHAVLEEATPQGATLPGRVLSGGLLALQVFLATILVAFALTMSFQARFIAERPLGFSTRDLHFVQYYCPDGGRPEPAAQVRCDQRVMEVIGRLPGVTRAGLFGSRLFRDNLFLQSFARSEGASSLGKAAIIGVGPETLDMMQAQLLAGRMFDPNSAYDIAPAVTSPRTGPGALPVAPVIISRAALPLIGAVSPDLAIGQRLHVESLPVASLEIVGVVEDWHVRSLRFAVDPIIFVPPANAISGAVVEIDPAHVSAAEAEMQAFWQREMYGMNSGMRWASVASAFELAYDRDTKLIGAVGSFATLAIAVAGLGVFGLSAFDVRRRTRDIGVRKALGATPARIAVTVLGRQLISASIASLLAWPFGYWIAGEWLTGYVYRTPLAPAALPLATLIVLVLVALATGANAIRAGAIRPGLALRATG